MICGCIWGAPGIPGATKCCQNHTNSSEMYARPFHMKKRSYRRYEKHVYNILASSSDEFSTPDVHPRRHGTMHIVIRIHLGLSRTHGNAVKHMHLEPSRTENACDKQTLIRTFRGTRRFDCTGQYIDTRGALVNNPIDGPMFDGFLIVLEYIYIYIYIYC